VARQKLGQKRHRPSGDWVQTSTLFEIAGIEHRYDQVKKWIDAVVFADKSGLIYGVEVKAEPSNPYDKNAIIVIGYSQSKGLFGQIARKQWPIGYVPKEIAKDITENLIAREIPISAELFDITLLKTDSKNLFYVRMLLLGPPGHGLGSRVMQLKFKEGDITALVEQAKRTKNEGLHEELLIQWCQSEIKTSGSIGPAPRPFLELAKLFRKQKRHSDEFDLLTHWDTFPKPHGAVVMELTDRLIKMRKI
jgi:hypothetical protein